MENIYLETYDPEMVKKILHQYGVVVIKSFFSPEQADIWKQEVIHWLISISDRLTENPQTWTSRNIPYGPRLGMMQSLISHCPTFWKIREAVYPIFCQLYDTNKLLTSMDGATVHPPIHDGSKKDWPHIDQTVEDLWCVQGQVVLSETTASFKCTPTSHLKHREILESVGKVGDPSNWLKINQTDKLAKIFGQWWQVPIHSPSGSVILWDSKTIHSAQKNDLEDKTGWRCAFYVCMRPAAEYSPEQVQQLASCFHQGRSTNHWGTKVFPKRPSDIKIDRKNDSLEEYSEHPERLVIKNPSTLVQKLVGLQPWD